MRRFRLLAAVLGAGLLTAACGGDSGDGGTDPQNQAPTANFAFECASLDCSFTDQSSDPDGSIAGWNWDFGDGNTSTEQNPTHHYDATQLSTFQVRLTVTDNEGATSAERVQEVTVSPPAGLSCEEGDCTLELPEAARVTVTLTSSDCEAHGNTFVLTQPVTDTLFTDGCYEPVPTDYPLNGGAAFTAGTQIGAEIISGGGDLANPPTIRVSGAYPQWTLEFDDGVFAGPGEPDFNDLVLVVTATPE